MKPKSETIWMAWHKKYGFCPWLNARTQKTLIDLVDRNTKHPSDFTPVRVTISPAKPRKRKQ